MEEQFYTQEGNQDVNPWNLTTNALTKINRRKWITPSYCISVLTVQWLFSGSFPILNIYLSIFYLINCDTQYVTPVPPMGNGSDSHTLTRGTFTVHSSPPSLQLICRRIFWAMLRSFCGWEMVRTLMAYEIRVTAIQTWYV